MYVFGHSIGTLITPRIAAKTAGIIAADGVGRNWIEYELMNLQRQLELDGEDPAKTDAEIAKKELCMHRLLIEKQSPADCNDYNTYPASNAYMQQVAALNIASPRQAWDIRVKQHSAGPYDTDLSKAVIDWLQAH